MEIIAEGLGVYLKSPSAVDAEQVARRANDYDIAYNIAGWGSFPNPYTVSDALSFIEKAAKEQIEGIGIHAAVRLKSGNDIIGMVGLKAIDRKDRKAEIGYWIGKEFWKKGYGTAAASIMTAYGFEVLGLNKIYARTFDFNKTSVRVLEKLGFEREGLLKEETLHKNGFVDEVLFGLLGKNYKHGLKIIVR
jgi:RimJ/RimL family protein N-acetyltransferase